MDRLDICLAEHVLADVPHSTRINPSKQLPTHLMYTVYLLLPYCRLLEAQVECQEHHLACLEDQVSPLALQACLVCQGSPPPVQRQAYSA